MGKNGLKQVLKIELAAIVSLFVAGAALALYAFFLGLFYSNSIPPLDSAVLTLIYTVMLGFIPVVLFGVPVYLALKKYGKDSWVYVILLGLFPGVAAFLAKIPVDISLCSLVSGVIVSLVTHLLCRRMKIFKVVSV